MKIVGQTFDTMFNAVKSVVEHLGGDAAVKEQYKGLSGQRILWVIWWLAHDNLRYDDSHPFFRNGKWTRIIPHDPGFNVNQFNDSHIETALRKIGKTLGLI